MDQPIAIQSGTEDEAEISLLSIRESPKRESARVDDHKQPHLVTVNHACTPSDTSGLSLIESDGTGEQLESLVTSRHGPPAESEAGEHYYVRLLCL